MSNVAQFPVSIPEPRVSFAKPAPSDTDYDSFIAVALFSGIGLLMSLLAILSGLQEVWF